MADKKLYSHRDDLLKTLYPRIQAMQGKGVKMSDLWELARDVLLANIFDIHTSEANKAMLILQQMMEKRTDILDKSLAEDDPFAKELQADMDRAARGLRKVAGE